MQPSEKKTYSTPKLIVHGALEEITKGCDKTIGSTDGFTFQGLAIVCTSS
jgi:hypothetical protein